MGLISLNIFATALAEFEIISFWNFCSKFMITTLLINIFLVFYFIVLHSFVPVSRPGILLSGDMSLRTFVIASGFSLIRGGIFMHRFIYSIVFLLIVWFTTLSNITGIIPFSTCATSYFLITLFFSGTFVIGYTFVGFKLHGSRFWAVLVPEGTPAWLTCLLVLIELISYIARIFSLSIRLFANMTAGHVLLGILSNFFVSIAVFVFTSCWWLSAYTVIIYLMVFAIFLFEIAVALLQAFVFSILLNIYLSNSLDI